MSMISCESNHADDGVERNENQIVDHLRALRREIVLARKKLQRTLEKQEAECNEALKWTWFRQIADSIMATPHDFARGTAATIVPNVHTGEKEDVRLNPKLDAFENAQLLYKKAKKGERGHEIAEAKVTKTRAGIDGLSALVDRIDALEEPQTADSQLLEELSKKALLLGVGAHALQVRKTTEKEKHHVPYRRFELDGFEVYAGKTDLQNDELTTRFAKPWDIWMHVAAHAGSHVVIRRQKNTEWPPRTVLEKAARLAVWFSKARYTSYAEVHITEARFVRKPRHAAPGKVIAERCKTLRVAPQSPRDMLPKKDFLESDDSKEQEGWE